MGPTPALMMQRKKMQVGLALHIMDLKVTQAME